MTEIILITNTEISWMISKPSSSALLEEDFDDVIFEGTHRSTFSFSDIFFIVHY